MVGLIEPVAAFVALVAIGILTSLIRPEGRIRRAVRSAMEKRRSAKTAHDAIPEIAEKLDGIEAKVDRNAYLIGHFHGEDDIPVSVQDIVEDDTVFRGSGGD